MNWGVSLGTKGMSPTTKTPSPRKSSEDSLALEPSRSPDLVKRGGVPNVACYCLTLVSTPRGAETWVLELLTAHPSAPQHSSRAL